MAIDTDLWCHKILQENSLHKFRGRIKIKLESLTLIGNYAKTEQRAAIFQG